MAQIMCWQLDMEHSPYQERLALSRRGRWAPIEINTARIIRREVWTGILQAVTVLRVMHGPSQSLDPQVCDGPDADVRCPMARIREVGIVGKRRETATRAGLNGGTKNRILPSPLWNQPPTGINTP